MQHSQQGSNQCRHHKHSNRHYTMGSNALLRISSGHSSKHDTYRSQTCGTSPSNISRRRSMHTQTRAHACNSSSLRAYTCR